MYTRRTRASFGGYRRPGGYRRSYGYRTNSYSRRPYGRRSYGRPTGVNRRYTRRYVVGGRRY